jgi:hypothetical protein
LRVLNDFARHTRYYNLNFLTGSPYAQGDRDPIDAWRSDVMEEILRTKYTARRAKLDASHAAAMADILEGKGRFSFTAEDGSDINDVFNIKLRLRQAEILQRESVVVCACLARHMADLLYAVNIKALGLPDMPFLYELFVVFYNKESLFRSRKVFSL